MEDLLERWKQQGDCKARWTCDSSAEKKASQESGWDLGIASLRIQLGMLSWETSCSREQGRVEHDATDHSPSDVCAEALHVSRERQWEWDVLSIICSLPYQTLQRGKKDISQLWKEAGRGEKERQKEGSGNTGIKKWKINHQVNSKGLDIKKNW